MGEGPSILLIHGTGASTHSWRELAPLLARDFTVLALDLPGHGFTECPPQRRLSLPAMASAVAALAESIGLRPLAVVGHSAGVAVALRCCLDSTMVPQSVISINGALMPFRGPAGYLFPPLAKLLFVNPLTPRIFARGAGNRERVVRLIRGTGSELDEPGISLYARLFRSPAHVAATLGMMANWDLYRFVRDLPALDLPLFLMAGENDQAVAPGDAERIAKLVSRAQVLPLPGLGHLAHEEDPVGVAEVIKRVLA
jgi:magnesium chelatase accessory protein